jgi:uncharacterized protein YbjQ (UPF0145 family)
VDGRALGSVLDVGLPLAVLALGFFVGGAVERSHLRALRRRELSARHVLATTGRRLPAGLAPLDAGLVSGSVVISVDAWKRFRAGLRALFGGRVRAYETLLERARREAVVRMKEQAKERGYQAVVHVRLATSRIASGERDARRTTGVEVLAVGTGVRLAQAGRGARAGALG